MAGQSIMNDPLSSLAVPCSGCGALLPVRPGTPLVPCRYCGAPAELAPEQSERLNRHVEAMRAAQVKVHEYRRDARSTWTSHRALWLYLFVFITPTVLLPSVFATIEAVSGVCYVEDLTGARFRVLHVLLCVVPFLSGACAALAVLALVNGNDARAAAGLASKIVDVSRCPSCGASMPVILAQDTQCPFCRALFLPGSDATRKLEAEARAQVGEAWRRLAHRHGQFQITVFILLWFATVAAFTVTFVIPMAISIARAMGWRLH